ncbi:hypothetical protein FOC4_g10001540 [Fusarium odoratissimum]|uniref:PD-(D/E)XK nuclease-like domain-containing protein n=2 Tax=Fusarium oxysporum species complex TaxID=171631 RepID=N1SBI6_FUSC4|nr:hypothetical protein FOC4_g10001540 [Fusarium odoratissimum]ENH75335.1 hypothetical protein FOC1_g10000816 [Fusarium oxysporum f. sp. cubense race 1]
MMRAAECEIHRECEAAWNGEIHANISEQAFRKSNGFVSDGPVDFRCSQAAQIIRDCKPGEAPSKMVDFCVICKPQLVASILDENDRPGLLKGGQFGGTDSELKIYSLIFRLRRLKRWIVEDYWPAFGSDVLGIS